MGTLNRGRQGRRPAHAAFALEADLEGCFGDERSETIMIGVPVAFEMVSVVLSIWALIALSFLPGPPEPNQCGPDPLTAAGQLSA